MKITRTTMEQQQQQTSLAELKRNASTNRSRKQRPGPRSSGDTPNSPNSPPPNGRSKPQTSRFGKPNAKKGTSSNASNSTNEFTDSDDTSSDEENNSALLKKSTTTNRSTAGSSRHHNDHTLLEQPNMDILFPEGASTSVNAQGNQTVTMSRQVTSDLAARWIEMGTSNASEQANQILNQGFHLNGGASAQHSTSVLQRNLRLEARLHHELEQDVARDEKKGIVVAKETQTPKQKGKKTTTKEQMKEWQQKGMHVTSAATRRNATSDDVFDRSLVRALEDPENKHSLRTIRLCEGDNVTSFVMPPATQHPIPITFTRAPKDMRLKTTDPTWLVINVQKILMTDHPLFITEDYVCARLHKVYAAYLSCMRKDRCGYYAKTLLNQLNTVKLKRTEVETYGLMEQKQGRELIQMCLQLIDHCSNFIGAKEQVHQLTTSVYRVWKDLKHVRKNAQAISTTTMLNVKQCSTLPDEVAAMKRLKEVTTTINDLKVHLESAGISGISNLAQKIKKVVSETLTKYTPLLSKTNLILSLSNDADRLSDSNCEHNELSRRKAINKSLLWTKIIINDNVVCTTVKKNILYPGFHSEYKNDIRIRLNQMPSNVVLEIWSSSGSLLGRDIKLATLPLDLPGGNNGASGTQGGSGGGGGGSNGTGVSAGSGGNGGKSNVLSVTSVAPLKVKYSFSSFKPMPETIASRVDFSMLLSKGSRHKNNGNGSDDSDSDSDGSDTNDMTQFISDPRQRFTAGEAIVTTAWAVDTIERPRYDNSNAINDLKNNNTNVSKNTGNYTTKILYPVPSHDAHLNLKSKIIGGPIVPAHMQGKPSTSIVDGAEFYDSDLMGVISRVPHIDPNDPKNMVLMDIMSHSTKSYHLGSHYRACDNSGHNSNAQFKSTDRLKFEPPRRHILLALRKHREHQFKNIGKPIPLTDAEILNDPFYKTVLSNYMAEQKMINNNALGSPGGGGFGIENDKEENEDDFFFEEILRQQKLRVQVFHQRIQQAKKKVLANNNGGTSKRRDGTALDSDAFVKEGILPFFAVDMSNILELFKPKRKLKPPSHKKATVSKPKQCTIRVHIINVTNAPTRFDETMDVAGNGLSNSMAAPSSPSRRNRRQQGQRGGAIGNNGENGQNVGNDNNNTDNEFSDDEYDNDEASKLAAFVGIEFQGEEYRTSTRFGANPQWNEPIDLPFIPNGVEGTSYTPRNLASIGDPIKISLFDEHVIQNTTERKYRKGVSYRNERKFLGGLSIPFSTVYVNDRIHGSLPLDKPVLTLGYRAHGQMIEGENITPMEERSRCDTLLKCVVTVDPPLVSYESESQLQILNTSGESQTVRNEAKRFFKSLGPKATERNIQLCCSNINARSVLVCRYILPQMPPPAIFLSRNGNGNNNTMPEEDAIQSIIRYVSLIPFMSDWSVFGGENSNVWCTSQQFLDLGCGDWEEHAILLCNFLNYYDQSKRTGMQSYIVLGRGLPEGDTVYTLRMNPTLGGIGSDVTLINASTGRGYSGKDRNCPLMHVDMIANGENIWINLQDKQQGSSHPSKMIFELDDPKLFKPLFGAKNLKPDTMTYVNNAELKHIVPELKNAKMMERELQETLKNQFKEWRQESKKGGLKTYTRFDQNISMELKPLLESFESAKREMNGFSEDSTLFVLCCVIYIRCQTEPRLLIFFLSFRDSLAFPFLLTSAP